MFLVPQNTAQLLKSFKALALALSQDQSSTPTTLRLEDASGQSGRLEESDLTNWINEKHVPTFLSDLDGAEFQMPDSMYVDFRRSPNLAHVTFRIRYTWDSSSPLAHITTENMSHFEGFNALSRAIRASFPIVEYTKYLTENSSKFDATAIAIRESSVIDLQKAIERLFSLQASIIETDAKARSQSREDNDKYIKERLAAINAELEDSKLKLAQEFTEKHQELSRREQEHAENVKRFNTHENKYVRREMLKKLEEVLKESENLKLSNTASSKRLPLHMAIGVVTFVSLTVCGSTLFRVLQSDSIDWHFFIPLGTSFATFVLTAVYYLKWSDRWFRDHADAELAAKRYRADMVRASWVAELVQESKDLPPEVVNAVSSNLFRDVGPSTPSDHPVESLGKLLRGAEEFELGNNRLFVKSKRNAKAGE